MAYAEPLDGKKFYVLVGDGQASEAFNFLCVATSVDSKLSAETETATAPDCDDPDGLAVQVVSAKSRSWSLSMSGLADPTKDAYQRLLEIAHSASMEGNFQLKRNLTGANAGGVYEGAFVITNFSESTADKGLVKFSADLINTGGYEFTAAA